MKYKHILSIICLAGALGPLVGCGDVGNGEKVGIITKATAGSGLMCKTNEVEIVRGGMSGGSGVVGAAFDATVEDPVMFEKLTKAMETQTEVKIKYRSELTSFCRSDSNSHFITSVEFADEKVVNRTANVAIQGPVAVVSAASGAPAHETHTQKVNRLLKVQAELLTELAQDSK